MYRRDLFSRHQLPSHLTPTFPTTQHPEKTPRHIRRTL